MVCTSFWNYYLQALICRFQAYIIINNQNIQPTLKKEKHKLLCCIRHEKIYKLSDMHVTA